MKDRIGKEVLGEITVFERDERIGGRKLFRRWSYLHSYA